jgi:cadmium resistance protein CadD (predicted permease)
MLRLPDFNMHISHRLGTFLVLVGLALLILFVVSYVSGETSMKFLGGALVTLVLGFLMQRNHESADSGRFKTIRRVSEHNRQRREEKKNKNRQDHFQNPND